ncbi:hypothetical protein OEZ86_003176 [Tetradesmus obliquus]|nr:hypothetical protein OEZ86_003176 [Tetradesmus obliquus]
MAGCASSFLQFAQQLHSLASPAVSPVPLVLLHTELPPREVFEAIAALGPTYFVRGKSSESAALAAACAENARSLVHLGPSERPTHLSAQAVSGVYGDPTSREPADYNSTSRTAVLADADALSSCYGVGEVLLPDTLHTVVELGFTSSIRFLQPGLLLHGHSAPHSHGSYDDPAGQGSGFGAGEIEEAGRAEGLTEWQLNSYYAAGRVMVPALLDTFTCQGFFKRRSLLELLTELAGDDGRPGGAMLLQLPVPPHLVGCTYKELVAHFLQAPQPHKRHVPLGLLRRKAENRAWRLPYVATHPDPDAVLQMTDAVFMIRPQ